MLQKPSNFSEKELRLIKFFGCESLVLDAPAHFIYARMMEKAFIDDMKGREVESLRRCMREWGNCSIRRSSKEWDDLIQFSE